MKLTATLFTICIVLLFTLKGSAQVMLSPDQKEIMLSEIKQAGKDSAYLSDILRACNLTNESEKFSQIGSNMTVYVSLILQRKYGIETKIVLDHYDQGVKLGEAEFSRDNVGFSCDIEFRKKMKIKYLAQMEVARLTIQKYEKMIAKDNLINK